jgi:2-polyprenyl-3-methyl-5-hydroxy-6-metoxy-1,4-benzoquinol methylase
VPENQHISDDQEKRRYDQHNNNPDDPGYRKFLSRLANPLCQRLPAGASGLDFGCGPGPALAAMLGEKGFDMAAYDKFYARNPEIFEQSYDFITATEVLEHFKQPGKEVDRLWHILRPGGILGIMTKLVKNKNAFDTWHYKRDPTHICFFSTATFTWLAGIYKAGLEIIGKDVILIKKYR